jgi:hypothetical protein
MSNGCSHDENASTCHPIYTIRQLALLLLKRLPTRSLIPCAKRTIMSHDYLNHWGQGFSDYWKGQLGPTHHLLGGLFHSWFICRQVAKSSRCNCQFRTQNLHLTSNWETTESGLPFKLLWRSLCPQNNQ